MPTVLAIVVTHRGRPWVKDCLMALDRQTYASLNILLVDDASPDSRQQPALKRIAKRHVRRRRWGYLRTPRPLGFGGAINWALSRLRTDADLLLFIHDDAALTPDSIEKMVRKMYADDTTSIVGPKIVSWEDEDRLEEIGMAVDRFGYPYKGLEDHEIDLGQHDSASETFYVTSTCMLIRHEVFKQLRGWDARMRAFTEDLDLCWRARLAGHSVKVEPAATARHAIALAKGERTSPFSPARYYIRRNRLRTILKNASGIRLLALIPLFFLLALAEMLGFVLLRQPREIGNLARALAWNVLHLPQTLRERSQAQSIRKVPDRKLRRLTIRQGTRVRFYVSHQRGRLEEAWGRRAELISERGTVLRQLASFVNARVATLVVVLVIGFVLGFRHVLFGPAASVGELLPYPESATAMWRAFVTPWRGVGLGQPGPAPPAFALLGLLPFLTFGASVAAQKLLVLGLGVAGFIGTYKLVAALVDRPSRFVAATVYALGSVGYAGVREGALGALVLGGVAPFVLMALMRLIGWSRPANWERGRAVARVALGTAVSAAFVPGSIALFAGAALLLSIVRLLQGRGGGPVRGVLSALVGVIVGWALLLPWSALWLEEGAPLDLLFGNATWERYAAGFQDHGFVSVLLGQTPEGIVFFGLALPLVGLLALLLTDGPRRQMALALWAIVIGVGWLVAAISTGLVRPVVASPAEAGVLASLAFSGLAGLALAGFRMDLPGRRSRLARPLASGVFALSIVLAGAGLGPAFLQGAWDPGRASGHADSDVTMRIETLLGNPVQSEGQFRALWVGARWGPPLPSVARPVGRHMVTGPRGEVLTDLFESRSGLSELELQGVISAVEQGRTDRAGSLLGAFNIGYVVLERSAGAHRWLNQADLAVARDNPEEAYVLLANPEAVTRAGIYEELPSIIAAIDERDPSNITSDIAPPRENASQVSSSRYRADVEEGEGVVFLAEAFDERWSATIDGQVLEREEGGWGNAFELSGAGGELVIRYPADPSMIAWLAGLALAWVIIVGAAFSRRTKTRNVV
jgi:GT2 family glycosyltransferase